MSDCWKTDNKEAAEAKTRMTGVRGSRRGNGPDMVTGQKVGLNTARIPYLGD